MNTAKKEKIPSSNHCDVTANTKFGWIQKVKYQYSLTI